ncbi:MAG: penicillin-binding transpeptidase domain-containing protein [Candidatus Omnitrophica bacterium]|nr:penicillin-binding transpeptidase domain-containing protein [Candidatus Omnitrophota bacterium]
MYISNYRRRIKAVFLFFFLFFLFCIIRLLFIQFFRSDYLSAIAKRQHNFFVELEPRRGTIFDTNLKPQAINLAVDSVFATPNEIRETDKEAIIRQLAPVLNLDHNFLRDRLGRNKSFVWLARKINSAQSEAIKKLNLKGVGFLKETRRSYHNGYLACHVFGFAGLDNAGLDGIELWYDKYLKGEAGWAQLLRDARQKKLDLQDKMVSPKDGYDVVLTIDEVIQYIAERELDKAYKANHAIAGSIVVMDPHTGAVLALANRPNFDLNEYAKANMEQRRNRAVTDIFEPGSVFKIVTASGALQENKVNEQDKFFCENGSYKFYSHVLHDHKAHGTLTFREVIEQSSNIGTSKVAQLLGANLLYRYIRSFGFGSKTGIDLPGEVSGITNEPRFWSKISIVCVPMGQEVGVTALQLANAISVIANGGQLMRPYLVKEVRDKEGVTIKKNSPQMIRKVISLDTAERVKKILVGVVEEGTGKLAKVPGFSAAGKTGTAQKLEPNGTYSHAKFVASFIGFAPAEDPRVAIAVILDQPHPYYFGGVVSAPVFKNVAADTLKYLRIKQSQQEPTYVNENQISD